MNAPFVRKSVLPGNLTGAILSPEVLPLKRAEYERRLEEKVRLKGCVDELDRSSKEREGRMSQMRSRLLEAGTPLSAGRDAFQAEFLTAQIETGEKIRLRERIGELDFELIRLSSEIRALEHAATQRGS